MAMTAQKIASGSRMRYFPTGGQLEELYFVDGLDPSVESNYVQAVGAPGIPVYQAAHPSVAGMSVMGLESWQAGDERSPNRKAAWVRVTYGTPDYIPVNTVKVKISGLNGTQVLNTWPYGPLQGKPILVGASFNAQTGKLSQGAISFQPQIDVASIKVPDSDFGFNTFYQTVNIPVLSGSTRMEFTRREPNPPQISKYRRKVNSVAWQGLQAGEWLCYDIVSENVTPGTLGLAGWTTTYCLISCPVTGLPAPFTGFAQVEYYRDEKTSNPINQANPKGGTYNGYTIVQPYDSVDFNALGLPNVY